MPMVTFIQLSTGYPLARMDNLQPQPSLEDHLEHVSAEYGIPARDLARVNDDADPREDENCIWPPPKEDTRSPGRKRIDRIVREGKNPKTEMKTLDHIRSVVEELIRSQ